MDKINSEKSLTPFYRELQQREAHPAQTKQERLPQVHTKYTLVLYSQKYFSTIQITLNSIRLEFFIDSKFGNYTVAALIYAFY